MALPAILLMAYHDRAFGSPWSTPYHFREGVGAVLHHEPLLGLVMPSWERCLQRLVTPRDGLLTTFPLLLLPFILLQSRKMAGRHKELAFYCTLVLMAAGYVLAVRWPGSSDAGMGSRFFLPAIPFAILAIGIYPDRLKYGLMGLCVLSVFWHFLGNSIGPQYLASLPKIILGIVEHGFSGFLLRNLEEHAFRIPPVVASLITGTYLCLVIGCLRLLPSASKRL